MSTKLTVGGLAVGYDRTIVLSDVDLDVEAGEVVAVVGPSGAGKSSFLLCLCGLLPPRRGTVTVDGIAVTSASPRERDRLRRERFGFVFQAGELVPELTLLENVALPLRLQRVAAREALARAGEMLDALGVGALGERTVREVSGGELQRAAIARALVHQPSVVLADEPTGALDEANADVVFDLLLHHARARGAAVVVVTHNTGLAARCDRVLRLGARPAPAAP